MLASDVQQSDSVIYIHIYTYVHTHAHTHTHTHTHIYILFQILFPDRLLQNIESSSLCYTLIHCWLSILYVVVFISEKAMAPHSSPLAWKIPRTEQPGRLQSMGSLGVGHDWATSLSLFTFVHWRRKWQPTPVFLPGESQGRGSLVGRVAQSRTEAT